MHKLFYVLLSLIMLTSPISAQGDNPPKVPEQKAGTNKADGITMPADMKVNGDEGFVSLTADCKGQVKFQVVSSAKIKYITNENTVIVSVPCTGGVITIFAIGCVDGKLTDFVSTNITIESGPGPGPTPPAPPGPTPPAPPGPTPPAPPGPSAKSPLHVTFVLDLSQATPQIAQLLNSQSLRKTITDAGSFFRIYDKSSPLVSQRGLDKVMQQIGGTNAMIVQNDQGAVLSATAIPNSETDVLAILNKIGGN